jgi:hypothetical protein
MDMAPVTVLLHHVLGIVGACSEEQVRRIAARRIVASMKNAESGWDRTAGQFPCETV